MTPKFLILLVAFGLSTSASASCFEECKDDIKQSCDSACKETLESTQCQSEEDGVASLAALTDATGAIETRIDPNPNFQKENCDSMTSASERVACLVSACNVAEDELAQLCECKSPGIHKILHDEISEKVRAHKIDAIAKNLNPAIAARFQTRLEAITHSGEIDVLYQVAQYQNQAGVKIAPLCRSRSLIR